MRKGIRKILNLYQKHAVWVFLSGVLGALPIAEKVNAQGFVHDGATWSSAILNIQIPDTPLSLFLFGQVRFIDNSSTFQTAIFSSILNYRTSSEHQLGIGYTALTPINNRILEILFLQSLYEWRLENVRVPLRTRLEWRWWVGANDFDDLPPASWRFRVRLDYLYDFDEHWTGIVNNEFFAVPEGNKFNQNRIQCGGRYRFDRDISLDLLYQNRIISSAIGRPNPMEHTLLILLIVRLSRGFFAGGA